jgi:hypothetical protein
MLKIRMIIALILTAPVCGQAFAHGGGLDANGCHTNRKTGDYHCHRSPSPPPPPPPRAPVSSFLDSPPEADSGGSARSGAAGWSYRNCTEARAAGAAPVRRGDPGYGPHLDRDNDGVGCE